MKWTMVSAAGLAALGFGAGSASAESGYLDVSRSHVDGDIDGLRGETDFNTLSGAIAIEMPNDTQIQIDAAISDYDDFDDDAYGGTFHWVTREKGWMFGGFVGGQKFADSTTWSVGAEGALYFERFTLAGGVGYSTNDDSDLDQVTLQAQGRYFINRNFRIDASADYARVRVAGVDVDGTLIGVGGEFRVPHTPFSFFGAYNHIDITDVNLDADVGTLGLRYNWDRDLAARDESGASLISVPNFGTLF